MRSQTSPAVLATGASALLLAAALAGCAAAPPPAASPAGCVHPAATPSAAAPRVDASQWPWWPEGLTPGESPVYVNNDIVVDAPPPVVWAWLTHADRWPEWFPRAKNVRFESGGPVLGEGTVVVWEMLGATIRVTVRRAEAPGVLIWEGGAGGVHAYHAWLLRPEGDRTHVTTVETEAGPLPALLGWYLRGALHDAHEDWLVGLARVASCGGPGP
jgi:hypothetical protein